MADRTVRGLLFVLSGPSGVGKDAVLDELRERGVEFEQVVTAVTRPRRAGEVDGVNYTFVSREELSALQAAGGLVEAVDFAEASPRGTPRKALRDALATGRDAILKIDVKGFAQVKTQFPNVVSIFLTPPSIDVLRQHLEKRDDVPDHEIPARLVTARDEIAASTAYDHRVLNEEGRLAQTVDQVAEIIAAERARVPRRLVEVTA